ncbi:hypothetical protein BDD12DRAFT_810864 [Trichophaea hybrida]|nr:hypothetical protein BDD12DRAFT_810864 [Trichophaea hybrida]
MARLDGILLSTADFAAGTGVKSMCKRWCRNEMQSSLLRTFRGATSTTVNVTLTHYGSWEFSAMIPSVLTDLVWGRAQSGPVPLEGQTGPGPRLAVLDWTCLV